MVQFCNSPFYLTPGELLLHFRYSPFYHSQSWWLSSATGQPSTSTQILSQSNQSYLVPQLTLLPHARQAFATFPQLTLLSQSSQSWWLISATQPSIKVRAGGSVPQLNLLSQSELVAHFRNSLFYHSQSWWLSSATHSSITVRAGGSVPQLTLL